jgi:ATP-dependent RNA helicase RhlB
MKFDELELPEAILRGIIEAGFTECTPIQEKSLPLALAGKDVAGQAQTGTGKTAAFLITLFTRLLRNNFDDIVKSNLPAEAGGKEGATQSYREVRRGGPDEANELVGAKSASQRHPRALILAPTRELVVQIEKDARQLGRHCGFTIQPIYGGVDYMKQRNALREGADVVIGTPGRLIDYLKQKVYSLTEIEVLVIDEADRMFDMGFISDLRYILRRLPPYDRRQNLMFSATLNQRVMELAYEFMNVPVKVSVTPEQMTAERVTQVLYHVARKDKFPLLLGLLRKEGMERTMIFVNTKREAEFLKERLNANDFPCRVISGDVEQKRRLKILDDFKNGRLPMMIGTDVASRGLHIEGVSHVINYDLPQDPEDYIHRIGRTARAGAEGKAISLADEDGAFFLEAIEEFAKQKIPSVWAEDELFVHDYIRSRPKRHEEKHIEREKRGRKRRSGGKAEPKKEPGEQASPRPPETVTVEGKVEKKKRRRPRKKKPAGEPQAPE